MISDEAREAATKEIDDAISKITDTPGHHVQALLNREHAAQDSLRALHAAATEQQGVAPHRLRVERDEARKERDTLRAEVEKVRNEAIAKYTAFLGRVL